MPIYEYWCYNCQKRVSLLQIASSQTMPLCPQCGSSDLHRLFSTFAVRKTYRDIYEDILSDTRLTRGMLANDPRALAEWNKRISRDEPVAPEYQEMLERMERGEMPDMKQHAGSGTEKQDIEG